MKFRRLQLNEWKQFQDIDIEFHDRLTVLTGANGSGKTTLLHLLARHFGWDFSELATPAKNKGNGKISYIANFWRWLKKKDEIDNTIGKIEYSDGTFANLEVPCVNSAIYQIQINQLKLIAGLNILSHRNVFKYQNVPSVATAKRNRKEAYALVEQEVKKDILGTHAFYKEKSVNYHIKETLLSWAIGGEGNSFIEPDSELITWFKGFEDVLKLLMPKTIGFQRISIRNYEIVLVTNSGDFMLDAVSGGIAALVDMGWQIYNLSNAENDREIVVLIDEVENHLHATMQRSVLPDLLAAFPNVQFIVSTHSPLVVASVKDSNVYAFRYNEENRVFSQNLDLVHKARTATEILNEVLGVPFTMPIWAEQALNEIIEKYRHIGLTVESVDSMRAELKEVGLESVMPFALNNLLDNDKID